MLVVAEQSVPIVNVSINVLLLFDLTWFSLFVEETTESLIDSLIFLDGISKEVPQFLQNWAPSLLSIPQLGHLIIIPP